MDQYQQHYPPGPAQQFQVSQQFPSVSTAPRARPQEGSPLISPGVPKAERIAALIAAAVILIGVFIFGVTSFSGIDEQSDASTAIASMTAGTMLILAHTISVIAIAYAIILIMRLTGRSPGKQSL
ncbi:MAG: hypothetical protein QM658_12775 [Gordonia sp. (in: high G+C Gram-positive bacteria)]